MLGLDTWALAVLGLYSVAVTMATDWLVHRLAEKGKRRSGRFWWVVSTLPWMVLLFAAGAVAIRYSERIDPPVLGYALFGLAGILVSLLRAVLYRTVEEGRELAPPLTSAQVVHTVASVLFAIALYLLVHWLFGRPVDPLLLIPLGIGTMLADLDSSESLPGRLLPFISHRLQNWLGVSQGWHSLAAALLVAAVTAPLFLLIPWHIWKLLPLGFLIHLVVDVLEPQGAMLLWPFRRTRYRLPGPPIKPQGRITERRLAAGAGVATAILLLLVRFGPPPAPAVVAPSYEQTLDRYYGLRGRNLVFASIQGTWQATGQRMSGRFEVLNARGSSYIVLDRYTRRIFTAGRSASDNLYLNYISLQAGDAVTIKPAEIHLRNQPLAGALPVIYEMQEEPGLQYIYLSGELVLPPDDEEEQAVLVPDVGPTEMPRIRVDESGEYSFDYLSAAELIALANLQVESAHLIIFATYVSPAAGPTVTPLPSPAASGQAVP